VVLSAANANDSTMFEAVLSERFYALVLLACSVICFNALQRPPW
jgi:hypothetical protein